MSESYKLIGFTPAFQNIHFVRDLTESEIGQHRKFTPIFAEARNRLKLFRILHRNYSEWRNYIDQLLNPQFRDDSEAMEHLDRLLLNYLTCFYTIREHFKVSFVQRFRNDPAKQEEYENFFDRLCTKSWAFAFFSDFRGYVQHVGLGIGHYHRTIGTSSVRVSVAHDPVELLAQTRSWNICKLTADRGEIDLVKELQEFHIRMLNDYASFVAKTFFPDVLPAAQFYGNLTKEVKTLNQSFTMAFVHGMQDPTLEGDVLKLDLHFEGVPNDVLLELGISVRPAEVKST
jgi:hypothetical protein